MKNLTIILSLIFLANSAFAMEMDCNINKKIDAQKNYIDDLPIDVLVEIIEKAIRELEFEGALKQLNIIKQVSKKFNSAANSNMIKQRLKNEADKILIDAQNKGQFYATKIKKLILSDANTDIKDIHGRTLLVKASCDNLLGLVKLLIQKNANLNIQSKISASTAIMMALEYDFTEIAKLLIQSGADLNIKRCDKKTALDIAEDHENQEIIELLKQKNGKRGKELP